MNHPDTAQAAYESRFAEANELLSRIAEQLRAHHRRQVEDPRDWGYPGALARVNKQLAEVLAELGDQSAVEARHPAR